MFDAHIGCRTVAISKKKNKCQFYVVRGVLLCCDIAVDHYTMKIGFNTSQVYVECHSSRMFTVRLMFARKRQNEWLTRRIEKKNQTLAFRHTIVNFIFFLLKEFYTTRKFSVILSYIGQSIWKKSYLLLRIINIPTATIHFKSLEHNSMLATL